MEKQPKISVVIATYNADKTLEACLKSVFSQTYPHVELVVADGKSTDRTLEILRRYENRIQYLISERDHGIYDAWNKVIPHVTGDWVIFLGADDTFWDEKSLESCAPFLTFTEERVVYGKVGIELSDGSILNFEGEPWEKVGKKFRHEMTIPHQGTFHRRTLFERYGLFDASFKICGDYEFLLRELKTEPARFMPNVTVARMGFGGSSSTLKNVPTIISELNRAQRMNGFVIPSIYVGFRYFRHFLRRMLSACIGARSSDRIADLYRKITGKPRLWTRFHD